MLIAAAIFASSPAHAQTSVPVSFPAGASGTMVSGTITGDEYVDYVLRARAGQTLIAALRVTGTNGNGSAMFNVIPAGADFPAIYNGSTDDDTRAAVVLPEDGDWAIRVYLMGNDRDAGRTVGYSIDVSIPVIGASYDPGATSEELVRFAAGATGAEYADSLLPGNSKRYVLGARAGQDLHVRVSANGPGISYQVFNPDGTFLLEQTDADRAYRGELR
jgi:hypothetical protein